MLVYKTDAGSRLPAPEERQPRWLLPPETPDGAVCPGRRGFPDWLGTLTIQPGNQTTRSGAPLEKGLRESGSVVQRLALRYTEHLFHKRFMFVSLLPLSGHTPITETRNEMSSQIEIRNIGPEADAVLLMQIHFQWNPCNDRKLSDSDIC